LLFFFPSVIFAYQRLNELSYSHRLLDCWRAVNLKTGGLEGWRAGGLEDWKTGHRVDWKTGHRGGLENWAPGGLEGGLED
jgi:hypothetical protein